MAGEPERAMLGKLPPDMLSQRVLRWGGAEREDLLVGGGLGEDAALIQWGDAPFLVAASDPIVGATAGAGRLLVHVNANDVACKGADPAWLIVTLIVPSSPQGEALGGIALIEELMREIHEACAQMGVAVAGGHTELTDRYDRPVLVGTMLGTAKRRLSVDQIQEGDAILVTGHAGIEGMSILAHDRPDLLSCLAPEEIDIVRGWSADLSVVPAARILRGSARYMHDPTEGGLLGALGEVCRARGLGVELDADAIPVSPLTARAAEALGFEPLRLISSGMLIAVLSPDDVVAACEDLSRAGVEARMIGSFIKARGTCDMDMREELWGILARGRPTVV